MQTNIVKRHLFSFFFIKGQEGFFFFLNDGEQERYSFYERAGRAQHPSETLWRKTDV